MNPTRKNILLVDDNPGDARLIDEALGSSNSVAKLAVVENAVQAFRYLGKGPPFENCPTPDLILMDLQMPVIAGKEAITIIRQESKWQHIPIMMLSSSTRQSDIDAAYEFGANLYVVKPARFEHYVRLAQAICEYLDEGIPIGTTSGVWVAKPSC